MTEQEALIQEIRERLGEMPKGALPFDLLAFAVGALAARAEAEVEMICPDTNSPDSTTSMGSVGPARRTGTR